MTKRLLILLVAALFTLSLASIVLSEGSGKVLKGIVTKIEGSKVTIMVSMGNEKTVEVTDQEMLKNIKVGDRVLLEDDKLTKEGAESSEPSPGHRY